MHYVTKLLNLAIKLPLMFIYIKRGAKCIALMFMYIKRGAKCIVLMFIYIKMGAKCIALIKQEYFMSCHRNCFMIFRNLFSPNIH
jgi:hypothetical protein